MSERRVIASLLGAAALLVVVLVTWLAGANAAPDDGEDPALDFYARERSTRYAGIDRWAFYGMRVEIVVERLERGGYACIQPPQGAAGLRQLTCIREAYWPMARTLTIVASVDDRMRGRLVAARASSVLKGGNTWLREPVAALLRRADWVEPDELQVRGLDADAETLARLALDALRTGGWSSICDRSVSVYQCAQAARERRASGFPALPDAPAQVDDARSIEYAMDRVRLLPAVPRGADALAADSLLVRVSGDHMWMDYASKSLTGRPLTVSVEVLLEGGAPVALIARSGAQTRQMVLAGRPYRGNGGTTLFLVPQAGAQPYRTAVWMRTPDRGNSYSMAAVAHELPRADPAFAPRLVSAILAEVAVGGPGLLPPLLLVERRAEVLRACGARSWFPEGQGRVRITQAFRDDPISRSAWAMALCEPVEHRLVAASDCWRKFTESDPAAAAWLRSEVREQQASHAPLEPGHPLRVWLDSWSAALAGS